MTLNTWNGHRGTKIREQVDKSLKLYMNKHLKSHLLVHLWSISVSLLFVDLTVEAPLWPHYTFTAVICVGSHPVCCNGDPLTQFYFMRNGQREMEANLECSWSSVCVGKKTKQKQKAAFPCALSWHRMACCMQSSSYHSLWMSSFSGHHCNTTVMCSVSTRGGEKFFWKLQKTAQLWLETQISSSVLCGGSDLFKKGGKIQDKKLSA